MINFFIVVWVTYKCLSHKSMNKQAFAIMI